MKKYIKYLFLIICIFTLSGCSINYNMEIYNEKIKEDVSIKESNIDILNDSEKRNILEESIIVTYDYWKETNNTNYKLNKVINNKSIGLEITGKDKLEVKNSLLTANNCYRYFNIVETKDTYVLSTSSENLCYETYDNIDEINIMISTNHKVVQHNAANKKKDTYIWKINKNNYKDQPIQLEFYKDKYVWNYNNKILKRAGLIIFIIGVTLLVGTQIYKKYKKNHGDYNF